MSTPVEPRTSEDGLKVVPFNAMRRRIAHHMVTSKATSPHVSMAVEADFSFVDRARSAVSDEWRQRHGFGVSYLPFVAYAFCRSVVRFPRVNGWVEDGATVLSSGVHLGIAVDLQFEGLIVPVIRHAETLSLAELTMEIHRVADLALRRGLSPDDVAGGTYTISNPGPHGTLWTTPIINQPQVAILSTDGVRKVPVVTGESGAERIEIRPAGVLVQSFDHRAIDGAYCAAHLGHLRELLLETDWLAEWER